MQEQARERDANCFLAPEAFWTIVEQLLHDQAGYAEYGVSNYAVSPKIGS